MNHNFEPTNSNFLDDDFSNLFGKKKGKGLFKGKLKKAFNDAKKNIHDTTKKAGKKIGDVAGGGKFVHEANKINPIFIGARQGLLQLLKNNVVGLATAYSLVKDSSDQSYFKSLVHKWFMYGGEEKKFTSAIDSGSSKPKLLQNIVDEFKKKKGIVIEANTKGAELAKTIFETFILVKAISLIPSPDPVTKSIAIALKATVILIKDQGQILQGFAKANGASEDEAKRIPHLPIKK